MTSLAAQYDTVRENVTGSTVSLYGDQSFINMPVGSFQGIVDYTEPDDAPLDFVYWFRNRHWTSGVFQASTISQTATNINTAKANKSEVSFEQ